MVSTIPNIIGAVLQGVCVVSKSPEILIIGRFVTGIGCGKFHFLEFWGKDKNL